jgi:hypothetical protein
MLTIRHDDRDVKRWLSSIGRQMPFAVMLGINRTAMLVKDELRAEMTRIFDRPRPATLNSLLTHMATKKNLEAKVWIKDEYEYNQGSPFINYLGPNIFGGGRNAKSSEKILRASGVLRGDMFTAHGKGAPLDQYGNIPRGKYLQMISGIGAMRDRLDNITSRSRARNPRRAQYFILGNPHLGIYSRQNGELKSILKFVKAPVYKKRLDFFGVGQRVIDENLKNETIIAIEQAMRTAR